MAAPTFAAQTSGGYDGADGTTLTVALPAGSNSYLAVVGVLRGSSFFNPPTCAGWTLIIENYTGGSTDTRLLIYKANTASSPGTVWTFPNAGRQQCVLITGYTDTDITVDASSAVTAASAVAPTVTATQAGLAVRAIADNTYNDPTPAYSYPAGTSHGTQVFAVSGDGCGVAYADASVSAGATGTATFGMTIGDMYEPAAVTIVITGSGGGASTFTGTVAQTLPKVAQAASGTAEAEYTGAVAQTLPHVTQAVAGDITSPGGATAQTLPSLTQSVAGTYTPPAFSFWTGISTDQRYFVDQNGDPFLIHGDSPWSLMLDLDTTEVDLYLSTRQSQGFNTILFSAIGTDGTGGPASNGDTYDGVNPFTTDWEIDSPNETYWARLDSYLDLCEDYGFSVQLYALDAFGAQVAVRSNTNQAQRLAYGAFLATRYGARPNVVWAVGGDFDNQPGNWTDYNPIFGDVVTGIRSVTPGAPVTLQLTGFPQSNSFDNTYWDNSSGAPLIQWSFTYTYNPTYDAVLQGYAHTWAQSPTTRPVLFSEGNYYQENNKPGTASTTDETLRRQMLWAITSGSPGEFYGAGGVWFFDTGAFNEWWNRITPTPAHVTQMQRLREFIAGKSWHKLVPDTGSAFVTAGRGTFVSGGGNGSTGGTDTDPLDNDYVTAAVAADKSLGMVYVPAGGTTITIDKTKINGTTAYWVDPTDATSTTTATFTGNNVTSPGNHAADGDGNVASDWLLVMEGTPVGYSGTVAQTLPKVAQSVAGTNEPEFTGTVAQALSRVAQAATGTAEAEFEGTIAQTLPHVTQAASGTNEPEYTGAAAQTLGLVGQAGAGTFTLPAGSGTMAQTLPHVTQSASGTAEAEFTGVVIQTLPHITQSGSGTHLSHNRTGAIVQTLGKVGQAAAGEVDNPPGNVGIIGQTLPRIGQAASGTNEPEYTGSVAQSLPSLTQSVTGTVTLLTVSGSISQQLPKMSQVASGTFRSFSTGAISQTLPHVTQYAQETPVVEIPYTFTEIAVTSGPRGSGISARLRNS